MEHEPQVDGHAAETPARLQRPVAFSTQLQVLNLILPLILTLNSNEVSVQEELVTGDEVGDDVGVGDVGDGGVEVVPSVLRTVLQSFGLFALYGLSIDPIALAVC